MADNRLTRQQIYDRIRETSKDDYILEEMKRLGFWRSQEGSSIVPELMIKKEAELQQELSRLFEQKRKYEQKESVLKEMKLKRMDEAKRKREETKKKREQQRAEKAAAWQKKRETTILYAGEEVSAGMNNTDTRPDALQRYGLPLYTDETALAAGLGITINELRFLSFSRIVSQVSHYRKFYLPKKSGGKRLIAAPMQRLKNAQYRILEQLLNKVVLHEAANGFVKKRSIVTNAEKHVGKSILLNVDIKDFFPSVDFKRVKGVFRKLGYAEKISTLLALICTEAPTDEVRIDGKNYFVQKGNRVLPQGAPTSPALTNILFYKCDKRLQGLAAKTGCTYTRYADDISFSSNDPAANPQQLVWRIKKILADEGFTVHPEKIRIMRQSSKQEVTGVVVNKKLNIDRKKMRQFRALIHNLKTKGPEAIHWGHGEPAYTIPGYLQFINMVNPEKGAKLKSALSPLLPKIPKPAINNQAPGQQQPDQPGEPPKNEGDWWTVV
jgi:retron-type reverse transcriptase